MNDAVEMRARGSVIADGRTGFAPARPGPRRRFTIKLTSWAGDLAQVDGDGFSVGTQGQLMVIDTAGNIERVYAPGSWLSILAKPLPDAA